MDECPVTGVIYPTGGGSKSPIHLEVSSPESDGMKSPSGRVSPDSRCVICLGRLQNKSFTDSCLHQFCFQCLLQWSKVKPECPLCKQPFKSIIHNVRSNHDYDQYHVERQAPSLVISDVFSYDLIPVERRFRYRSTMTREYFREIAETFLARTRRLQQDQMEHFAIPPMVPIDSEDGEELGPRERRRGLTAGTHYTRLRQMGTSQFRRSVYHDDLWVQDLPDVSGRYRDCTPAFYRDNPAQVHRLVPWLNRELNALLTHSHRSTAALLDGILAMLPLHSIRSRSFRELVEPHVGDRTDHFIHEFHMFAKSVYDLAGFDQCARYAANPNFGSEVQDISSSSAESDVEVIETAPTSLKKMILKRASEDAASSGEPVAGPSGMQSFAPIELEDSDPEDVLVVDYCKPSPQVVTISSEDETPCGPASPSPSPSRTPSPSPARRPSPSPSFSSPSSPPSSSSSSDSEPRYSSAKGKCRSRASLKGKQKRRRTRSMSGSSSDYKPIAKLMKRKRKKEVKKKKKTKRKVYVSSEGENERKRVRSCVVVPRRESTSSRNMLWPRENMDDGDRPLASYWSLRAVRVLGGAPNHQGHSSRECGHGAFFNGVTSPSEKRPRQRRCRRIQSPPCESESNDSD